jgi:hypothetical protein
MCPLLVLNFIFEPLFVHAPDIIVFLKFHLGRSAFKMKTKNIRITSIQIYEI